MAYADEKHRTIRTARGMISIERSGKRFEFIYRANELQTKEQMLDDIKAVHAESAEWFSELGLEMPTDLYERLKFTLYQYSCLNPKRDKYPHLNGKMVGNSARN